MAKREAYRRVDDKPQDDRRNKQRRKGYECFHRPILGRIGAPRGAHAGGPSMAVVRHGDHLGIGGSTVSPWQRLEGGATGDDPGPEDLSPDLDHVSVSGHAKMAAIAWDVLWRQMTRT